MTVILADEVELALEHAVSTAYLGGKGSRQAGSIAACPTDNET